MTASRRLWLYGLFLLLPALAVGGLALGLLAREQARLAEREQAAAESRRGAVAERTRIIAENIELLVGDVQSALLATLAEAPAEAPDVFLAEWRVSNPLVRDVFRADAKGRPVWGADEAAARAWLAEGAPWTGGGAVVRAEMPAHGDVALAGENADNPAGREPAVAAGEILDGSVEPSSRRNIAVNVQQYQRARWDLQQVAKLRNAEDVASQLGYVPRVSLSEAAPSAPAPVAFGSAPAGAAPVPGSAGGPVTESPAGLRSGWTPWRAADGVHVFGWRELPDRSVLGLELRLDAIKARLGEVFPAAPESGEAYALRDAAGSVWHQAGASDFPVVFEVPLALAAVPGWTVAGAWAGDLSAGLAGGTVFGLGASLVGLLVVAILAAGALLLRQARLSEAEAALKTSFVANVSHELKTPLTTIRLYAELLEQGRVGDPARRADYLATIGRETQRLARLVGNVLDFSRLEQGKKKFARTEFDLATEIARLADMHGPRLAEAGLALRIEAPASCPVTADRDAVEQIVLNLLDNACKYAAAGGELTLVLGREGPDGTGARLSVGDRGPGVAAGQRERVFEKFHRVDDRLTAEKGGAGLGLSIARQLARGLGGELVCNARAGGGAEFVLTLP